MQRFSYAMRGLSSGKFCYLDVLSMIVANNPFSEISNNFLPFLVMYSGADAHSRCSSA